jgi:hypothetical protein
MAGWLSYHIHLGDLPTWLAAIGALIAAAFALGQLKELRKQNATQQRELDSQAEELAQVRETQRKQTELLDLEIRDRRAGQARQIEVQRFVDPWADPGSSVINGYALYIRLTNNSHSAISDIDAFFSYGNDTPSRGLYSLSVPRTPAEVRARRKQHGPVPVARLDPGRTVSMIGPTYDNIKANDTRGEVRFTDAEGRRWQVDHVGKLSEVDTEQPH